MVNETRIIENFIKLTGFDSESFYEREIGQYVREALERLGLTVRTDTTETEFLKSHPHSYPNIYGFLKGNRAGGTILFAAHLDTVAPGNGKKAVVTDDGRIVSGGASVLGADDVSGIVSILESLQVIQERGLSHPDIEVLITAAEEPFCEGSRFFDYSVLKAEYGYVLDLTGPVGTAAVGAPSILSFEIDIKGRAAHAGFAPEDGVNALNIAVESLKGCKTGRMDAETTVNFGTICGGTGKNIVPEQIQITGEIRSLSHEKAVKQMERIRSRFTECARKAGGVAYCCSHEHIRAFQVEEEAPAVQRFRQAVRACGFAQKKLITTFGGSDGNRLNEHGIPAIVLACAMENVHTAGEYTTIEELKRSAELVLQLMTV